MRLAYLLQVVSALCVRSNYAPIARIDAKIAASLACFGLSGFPARSRPALLLRNEGSWTARARLPLRRSTPYARGGQNEVDEPEHQLADFVTR